MDQFETDIKVMELAADIQAVSPDKISAHQAWAMAVRLMERGWSK